MALAIVTCMDNRLPTGRSMGLAQGEAFVLRNAGGRVTDDVLRSLTVACSALDVRRVAVVHHTDCRALAVDDAAMRQRLTTQLGADPGPLHFFGHLDLAESVRVDMAAVRTCRTIPTTVAVDGFVYDVVTGQLRPLGAADRGTRSLAPDQAADRVRPSAPSGYRSDDGLPW